MNAKILKMIGGSLLLLGALAMLFFFSTGDADLSVVFFVTMLILPGFFLYRRGAFFHREGQFGEGYKYSFYSGSSGIAVAPDQKLLKLRSEGKTKEYNFADVRSWESNLQSGGMAVHGGSSLSGASNVGAANLGRSIANRRASGLFVLTRDVDNPRWRVEMLGIREQSKWMEILQQSINE